MPKSKISIAAAGVILMSSACIAPAVLAQQTAVLSADAELATKGVWHEGTRYFKDDIVTLRGSAWIAKRDNRNRVPGQTRPSTADDWRLFARGLNPTGAWSNATKYQPDDLVTFNGQTFRAKLTNANRQPAANQFWELLAAKGANGAVGATGPEGPPGPNTGIGAGSQSAPSISFNSDPDTGIFRPAENRIALVEGGSYFLHNLGVANTALGQGSLPPTGTGSQNTAIGFNTLANNNSANNTAVGSDALKENTTGSDNVALGGGALTQNVSGHGNVAVGQLANASNVSGIRNVAVGRGSLFSSDGSNNVAIGHNSLSGNVDGQDNIAIGYSALAGSVSGSRNIAIGALSSIFLATSDNILIGYGVAASENTPTIKIGAQGTQTRTYIAGISGADASTFSNSLPLAIDTDTGQLGVQMASSRQVKDGIAPMADMTATLEKLRPVTFHYRKPADDGRRPMHYGLIAEEVAEVMPYLAAYNADGTVRTVHYDRLPTFLLVGWQAQQRTIAAQANEIAELKRRLAAIEGIQPGASRAAMMQGIGEPR